MLTPKLIPVIFLDFFLFLFFSFFFVCYIAFLSSSIVFTDNTFIDILLTFFSQNFSLFVSLI